MRHPLLDRQLAGLGLRSDAVPSTDEWTAILDAVSLAYDEADKARRLADRALRVTSSEMREMYAEATSVRRVMTDELETLHGVFHHIESGLCTLTPDGCVSLMNPAAEALLGWSEAQLIGQPVLDLFSTDGSADDAPGFVHAGAEFRELNGSLTRADGTRVPIAFSLTPIAGRPESGAVLLFWDNAVQQDSRTELIQAKSDAEAATDAKTDFLVSMSHEVRTPMNALMGLTSLLENTDLDERQQELCQSLRASADTLLTLLTDVLDYSHIEAGDVTLHEKPFEVRACVEDVLDMFAIRAVEKGIELAYTQSEAVPQVVVGDVDRLRQILVNLVGNALKFTDEGHVVVDVRSVNPKGSDADARVRLKITVRDTGRGISPEQQERLFEAFNEPTPTMSRRLTGTGIGLAICKRLTDLLGGSISVRSRGVPGKGSAFTFTIQARVSDEIAHMNDVVEVPDFADKHLLIVEDNEIVRGWLADNARNWGFRVTASASAEEARLHVSSGAKFDLAFVDESLPEESAVELVHSLLTNDTVSAVIGLTLAREAGAEPVEWAPRCAATISKPIRLTEYWNTMAVLLMSELDDPFATIEDAPPIYDEAMASEKPLRILVAEDDAMNQRVTAEMLAGFGYSCTEVSDGREALDELERNEYDLVLLDLLMPNLDGFETAEAIFERRNGSLRPVVIAVSASAYENERERCLDLGMLDYVEKPVRVDSLRRALEAAHEAVSRDDVAA